MGYHHPFNKLTRSLQSSKKTDATRILNNMFTLTSMTMTSGGRNDFT